MHQIKCVSSKITYQTKWNRGHTKNQKLHFLFEKFSGFDPKNYSGTEIYQYQKLDILQKFSLYYKKSSTEKQQEIKISFQNALQNRQPENDFEEFFHMARQNRSLFFQRQETTTIKKLKDMIFSDGSEHVLHSNQIATLKTKKFTDDHRASMLTLNISSIRNRTEYLEYHKNLHARFIEIDNRQFPKQDDPEVLAKKMALDQILASDKSPSISWSDWAERYISALKDYHAAYTESLKQNTQERQDLSNIDKKEYEFIRSILMTNPYVSLHRKIHEQQLAIDPKHLSDHEIKWAVEPKLKQHQLKVTPFQKSSLPKQQSIESRNKFNSNNSRLFDFDTKLNEKGSAITRRRDDSFPSNVAEARSHPTINQGSVINLYDVIKTDDHDQVKSKRVFCGAVHTQTAAKQYVLKMILENTDHVGSEDTFRIIDTRYLSQSHIGFSKIMLEKEIIEDHRNYISNVITSITDDSGCIQFEKLNNLYLEMKTKNLITNPEKDLTGISTLVSNKKLELISLDFATEKNSLHKCLMTQDKESILNLKKLQILFEKKISTNSDLIIQSLLTELQKFNAMPDTEKSDYLIGKKAFYLDEVVSRLCDACGIITSCGSKSNEHRSSAKYTFSVLVELIMEHRKRLGQSHFSLLDFQLETQEEKQLARNLFFIQPHFMPTLLSDGYAGTKNLNGLEDILEQAFYQDKESLEFYTRELQRYSAYAAS